MKVQPIQLFYGLLFFLLIAPFGVGIPLNIGFKTLDLPKIFTLLLLIVFGLNLRVYKSSRVSNIFSLIVFLHLFSTLYAFNVISNLISQFGFLLLYYSGYYIIDYFVQNHQVLTKVINLFKISYLILASFAILEFALGYNPIDPFRTAYLLGETTRFNGELGIARGFKSSMGIYPSTLPFAYMLSALFFLHLTPSFDIKWKNKYYSIFSYIVGIPALFATQSRAMYIFFGLVLVLNLLLNKGFSIGKKMVILALIPLTMFLGYMLVRNNVFGTYIDTYVLDISSSKRDDDGLSGRFNNNVVDFEFALLSPIWGHGGGTLLDSKHKIADVDLDSDDSSFLITIFADRGLISLFLFILFIYLVLVRLKKMRNLNSIYSLHAEALFYSIIVFTLCLNSSQREESLFIYFALLALGNRTYELFKADNNT